MPQYNACHPLDIELLAEAGLKHYFCTTDHDFQAEELDLHSACIKESKRPFVNWLKEPPCIAREWNELMAFMITSRHLDVGLLTAEDIDKEQEIPGGIKESSSKGKGLVAVTLQSR